MDFYQKIIKISKTKIIKFFFRVVNNVEKTLNVLKWLGIYEYLTV